MDTVEAVDPSTGDTYVLTLKGSRNGCIRRDRRGVETKLASWNQIPESIRSNLFEAAANMKIVGRVPSTHNNKGFVFAHPGGCGH